MYTSNFFLISYNHCLDLPLLHLILSAPLCHNMDLLLPHQIRQPQTPFSLPIDDFLVTPIYITHGFTNVELVSTNTSHTNHLMSNLNQVIPLIYNMCMHSLERDVTNPDEVGGHQR